jgi:hypothetical protein
MALKIAVAAALLAFAAAPAPERYACLTCPI